MQFSQLIDRAKEIREKYAELEKRRDGKEWTREQLMQGFLGDVEDLKAILASENIDSVKLSHELSDCLWSILILADKYEVNLEKSFLTTMSELEKRIEKQILMQK